MNQSGRASPYHIANVRAALGHYLLGRGASAVTGLATIILLVRVMDVAAYASYIALMGLAGIATMLSSLGLERAITRFVPEGRLYQSEDKLQGFVWKIVLARLATACVVTLLLAAVWQWLIGLFDFVSLYSMPWALATYMMSNSLFGILSTVLQALVRQKLLTQIMVLIWAGRLFAMVYLAYSQGGLGLGEVLWLMAVTELVGAMVLLFAVANALRHGGVPVTTRDATENSLWPQWQEVRSLSGHAYAFNVLASLPQGYFMRTLVAAALPVDIVAAYGFFSSLIDKMRMYLPMQLMYNLVEPVLVARYLQSGDEQALARHIWLIYKANLLILAMALVFLYVGGQSMVGLLTGGKFIDHAWILSLLVVQIALGSHVLAIQLVVNVHKQNWILSSSGTVALLAMMVFIGIVFTAEQPLWLLFAVLVYDFAMNFIALQLIAQRQINYRPRMEDTAKLVTTILGVALLCHLFLSLWNAALSPLTSVLMGTIAALVLATIIFILRYANQSELGMLEKLRRAKQGN